MLSRRLMRRARSIQIRLIDSHNHIRRVFDQAVQFSWLFWSLINHAIRYNFITRIMFSCTELNLCLHLRLTSNHKYRVLLSDIFSKFESNSFASWIVDFTRDCDDSDWRARSWIIFDVCTLLDIFNVLKKLINTSRIKRDLEVNSSSSKFFSIIRQECPRRFSDDASLKI